LFFNVPARRKFLRAERTELSQVERLVERLALSRFDVGFRLMSARRVLADHPPARDERGRDARVAAVLGDEFIRHALKLDHEGAGMRLSGWFCLPTYARSQADQQHFFLNGRPLRDKLVASAVRLAYRDVLYHGRHPAYVLYLDMDPARVDVNAHPQKLEVRFREPGLVHDFIFRTLERALAETRPTQAAAVDIPAARFDQRMPLPRLGRALRRSISTARSTAVFATARRGRHSPRRRRWRSARSMQRRPAPNTRWVTRSRNCTASTSSHRRRAGWCWWTCTQRTSAPLTSDSRPR